MKHQDTPEQTISTLIAHYSACLLLLLSALISSQPALGADVIKSSEASRFESAKLQFSVTKAEAKALTSATDLLITGTNHSDKPSIVVLRLDDREKPGYRDRVNLERVVPPGQFRLSQLLGGLATSGKRPFELNQLQQIIIFAASPDDVTLNKASLVRHKPLPDGSVGWDLGPKGSALWPGFQPLLPDSKIIKGRSLQALDRGKKMQASEGLTTDGIQGIESLNLPLRSGQWAITLWLRDPGEWEYLPPVYQREISVNGTKVNQLAMSSEQWTEQVYLARQWPEANPGDTSYARFSSGPHARVSFNAVSQDQGIEIAIKGNQPQAGFVSAILAEPLTKGQFLMPTELTASSPLAVRDLVEQARQNWWDANWPLKPWQPGFYNTTVKPADKPQIQWLSRPPALVSPGSWFNVSFRVKSGAASHVSLQPMRFGSYSLPTQLRYGHWLWRRSALQSTLLVPDDSYLRAGQPRDNQHPAGRLYHLRVKVPARAAAGVYNGEISIAAGPHQLLLPLTTQVMQSSLPQPSQTIGVYLEEQVQYAWFKDSQALSEQALQCDLKFLKGQGLTSVAPPLPTPKDGQGITQMLSRLALLKQSGFDAPVLAYTPLKRLIAAQDVQYAASQIAALGYKIKANKLAEPIWVSADEPDDPESIKHLQSSFRYVKAFSPYSKLAGHLNSDDDRRWLSQFDLLLVNHGFGIDKHQIADLPERLDVWLYNLDPVRHAAGFYLWQSGAKGLMQWHARMPTADPFNPTDGREADIQFLYPSTQPCPLQPDVNHTLFELTDGIMDLRWLTWLEQQAPSNPQAAALLSSLQKRIPDNWQDMVGIPESTLDAWRDEIIQLKMKSIPKLALQNANESEHRP